MHSPLRSQQYEWTDKAFQQWQDLYASQQPCFESPRNELETIQEEDDEIQFCTQVQKLSGSGLMYNKRVLSLESEHLCYYSHSKAIEGSKINTLMHQAKVRISLKDITEIVIPSDKPTSIRITGHGPIITKKSTKKAAKFSYLFRFSDAQTTLLWRNLILATQEAKKSRNYIVTFENLLKHSRSNSACSYNSSNSSSNSSSSSSSA